MSGVPRTLRWVGDSTIKRISTLVREACDEWSNAWVGCALESEATARPLCSGPCLLSETATLPDPPGALLGVHGLHDAILGLLSIDSSKTSSLAAQVTDEASRSMLLRLAKRLFVNPACSPSLAFAAQAEPPAADEGCVWLDISIGSHSFVLVIDGASVVAHSTPPVIEALRSVSPHCFERPAKKSLVALEMVVGKAVLSIEALQQAEIGDVFLLDTATDAPMRLHAPQLGLEWPAYLGAHEGHRVAETAHDA